MPSQKWKMWNTQRETDPDGPIVNLRRVAVWKLTYIFKINHQVLIFEFLLLQTDIYLLKNTSDKPKIFPVFKSPSISVMLVHQLECAHYCPLKHWLLMRPHSFNTTGPSWMSGTKVRFLLHLKCFQRGLFGFYKREDFIYEYYLAFLCTIHLVN